MGTIPPAPEGPGKFLVCFALLGLMAPAILFAFVLLFGENSYQYWGDRYHIDLTNKFIFSRLDDGSVLGPLWRDDTLGGFLWIVSLVSSPLSLDVLAARWFHLSPLGIEAVGTLLLYYLAATSMYLYLSRVPALSREASVAAAATFACATYWDYSLNTNPNVPMAVAWLPALLVVSHRVEEAVVRGEGVWWPASGLALLFAACALHGSLSTLPITLILVSTYTIAVLRPWRTGTWVAAALVTGLLLYAPFLWLFVEAASLSHRNTGAGFYKSETLDLPSWVTHGKLMAAQFAVGVNRYGVFLVVLLGVLWWCGRGARWASEPPGRLRVLRYAAVIALAVPLIELLHDAINEAKGSLPLVRGWNVQRFADFGSFGVATMVGWMWDRSLFHAALPPVAPARQWVLRGIIAAVGLAGSLQIGHVAYRLQDLPHAVAPQGFVLAGFLALYALVLANLLFRLYRRTVPAPGVTAGASTGTTRLGDVAHLVAAVALITSVHAYRGGLVRPQGIEIPPEAAPVMTYAQRYALPEDVLRVKQLVDGDGRVLDLTRPLKSGTWLLGSEITLLPLAGLRVLSGYSNLYPAWYGQLIQGGINGTAGSLWNIVQVDGTGMVNWEALPLLDVRYILAPAGRTFPHYRPVAELEAGRRMLYQLDEPSRAASAFLSPGAACYRNADEAVGAIHEAGLPAIRARAILLAGDPTSTPLCAGQSPLPSGEGLRPPVLRTVRGRDRVTIDVEDSPGGVLTLSDVYYPGWRVYVNGAERPLLRTYVAFRGVAIEPGRQTVEFVFAPPLFHRLLMVSAVTLGGMGLVSLVLWTGRRTAPRTQAG